MNIVTDFFQCIIEILDDRPVSLIIENPSAYYKFVEDIYNAINGGDTTIVLSEEGKIINSSKKMELITTFIPFEINEKRLLNKINGLLEDKAVSENKYIETMRLLTDIEGYMYDLSRDFPYNLDFSGISITSLIKMCGTVICDDSNSPIQRVLNYMEIVRDLLGDKLFIYVNMGAFFNVEEINMFIKTVSSHKFYVMMIDNYDYKYEKDLISKLIIDKDLCII